MPDAGRDDYTKLIRFSQLEQGEPYFFVRGRDPAAGDTTRFWAARANDLGVPSALLEQALQHADLLDAWPVKRAPDADHLEPHEVLQLEYQLSRRAWSADDGHLKRATEFLAERRGYNAAGGLNRTLVSALARLVDVIENPKVTKDELASALAFAKTATRRAAEAL